MTNKFKAQLRGALDAKFPFEILENFEGLDQEYVIKEHTSRKKHFYDNVDHKKIIFDTHVKSGIKITVILMIVIIFFILILQQSVEKSSEIDTIFTGFLLFICFSVLVISIIRFYYVNKKSIELNREDGKITFQKPLGNKTHTYPFNEMEAVWQGVGGSSPDMLLVIRLKENKKIGFRSVSAISHIRRSLIRETLSFYVWYMDKNRPLPPGTAFDPYRQADFERRKSEGFPKPLYRSHIITPEATPEQQAEREQYWKDELEEFTREPNSVMYDPKIHKNWTPARWLEDDDSLVANTYFKFVFKSGDIIYMKTDENGSGFKPPLELEAKMTRIELFESRF